MSESADVPAERVPTIRVLIAVYRSLAPATQHAVDAETRSLAVDAVRRKIAKGPPPPTLSKEDREAWGPWLEPIRESTTARPCGRWDCEVAHVHDWALWKSLLGRGLEVEITRVEDFPEALEELEAKNRLPRVLDAAEGVKGAPAEWTGEGPEKCRDRDTTVARAVRDGKLAAVGPDPDAWPEGRE